MRYLITGGCGFLGSNVAAGVLADTGSELTVYDNLSRVGSRDNLEWLRSVGDFDFVEDDVSDFNAISKVMREKRPDVVYHFAGQVAMTTSIADPRLDFNTNTLGTFNVLESIRLFSDKSILVYSSTNKVYGDFEYFTYRETDTRYVCNEFPNGFDESVRLDFHSPYGCSKGAADQYILDYSRMYGVKAVVFRHSSMFGTRQYGTFDQGWVSWFIRQALDTKSDPSHAFTIAGNGKQVRDVLFADDMVRLYKSVPANIDAARGQAFNIGGGYENSLSLLELFKYLETKLGVKLSYTKLPPRQSDQKVFVADISKASKIFNWRPRIGKFEGIDETIRWVKGE